MCLIPQFQYHIITQFLSLEFRLKLITIDRAFAENHYADLSTKPFLKGLLDYIISGPVVAMVWEGKNVVTTGRKITGATNPAESAPGTIRGDLAIDIGRNVVHGSDSVESCSSNVKAETCSHIILRDLHALKQRRTWREMEMASTKVRKSKNDLG